MQTFTANQAKTHFGEFLDLAQREPVRVMRRESDVRLCELYSETFFAGMGKMRLHPRSPRQRAYVTAMLYRPSSDAEKRMPARALGLAYADVDPGDLKLDVGITAPTGHDDVRFELNL